MQIFLSPPLSNLTLVSEETMKTFIWILLMVCGVVIASAIVYLDRQNGPAAQKSMAEAPAQPAAPANVPIPAPKPIPAFLPTDASARVAVSASVAPQTASTNSVSPIHKKAVALLSAKSAAEKHALFEELRKDGQLDAVITDLKQMAATDPNNPEIPTTVGEAELNEVRAMKESGTADNDQMGILAMQADQEFNDALKIDPQNWEAQFVKDASMYYWPANSERDNQVVNNLTSLIDQQEKMPSNPDFAQTYVLLGNEYQKIGQPDKAQAAWQLGAQQYPSDSTLQSKLAGQ
jgi:tetratricopeptide (TPR) repeat protein